MYSVFFPLTQTHIHTSHSHKVIIHTTHCLISNISTISITITYPGVPNALKISGPRPTIKLFTAAPCSVDYHSCNNNIKQLITEYLKY